MFSTGQIIFALFFVVVFIAVMVWSYRKDIPLHNRYYKGAYWILIGLLVFVALLFVVKRSIYN